MIRYSVLRLLVFFGVLSALWLLGLRDRDEQVLLLALSAVISLVISWFVLKPFREDYSRQLAERLERRAEAKRSGGRDSDEAAEDTEAGQGAPTRHGTEPEGPAEYR